MSPPHPTNGFTVAGVILAATQTVHASGSNAASEPHST